MSDEDDDADAGGDDVDESATRNGSPADDPFEALDDEFDAGDDPFADLDDAADAELFDEQEVGDLDEASVWAALGEEAGTTDVAVGGELPDVETEAEEQVVPKASYCEKCEHFSAPPQTACTHPGTEIRALVDMDHFTVVNCPVVAKRRGIADADD